MSENIDEIVCNLIRIRSSIGGLYSAVNRARNIRAFNNGSCCYKFNIPGFGSKIFNKSELLRLDEESLCRTIESVLSESPNMSLTMRQIALLFLIVRMPIQKLYQSYNKALYMKSTGRKFCFTFCNPFRDIGQNNIICKTYHSQQLIDLFCNCGEGKFNIFSTIGNMQ